jgi:hypothetical protein
MSVSFRVSLSEIMVYPALAIRNEAGIHGNKVMVNA